jgi:hypothetical protein
MFLEYPLKLITFAKANKIVEKGDIICKSPIGSSNGTPRPLFFHGQIRFLD